MGVSAHSRRTYWGSLTTSMFGAIVTMDYEPELRIMLLCPLSEKDQIAMAGLMEVWSGVVLTDDPANHHAWPSGSIITLAPGASGVSIAVE